MAHYATALPFIPQRRTLATLRAAAAACQGCDLYLKATQTVFGEGVVPSRLMLVGETPGEHEDRAGRPFVGPAGSLLDESIAAAGLDRGTIYVTNAVKHFRWEERGKRRLHKKPSSREVGACHPWLEAEIAHYYDTVVDPRSGLVRSDRKFSAHRDTVVNRSNAFGNSMVALLAKTIEETGWFTSPFERHFEGDYGRLLIEHFWVGDHFRDALGDETVSGEANIWPFYTGVLADPLHVASALRYLDANGFCDPYPLRYETSRRPEREVWLTRHVLPDYQGSTVWTSLGAMYLQVLRTVDPLLAASETARYVSWIERDGTL